MGDSPCRGKSDFEMEVLKVFLQPATPLGRVSFAGIIELRISKVMILSYPKRGRENYLLKIIAWKVELWNKNVKSMFQEAILFFPKASRPKVKCAANTY